MAKAFKWLFGAIVILILSTGVALGWIISTLVSPLFRIGKKEEKLSADASGFPYSTDNIKSIAAKN